MPCGMPGSGEEIEGAMQHAPQPGRQYIAQFNARFTRAPAALTAPGESRAAKAGS